MIKRASPIDAAMTRAWIVLLVLCIQSCSSDSQFLQSYLSASGHAENAHGFREVVKVGREECYFLSPYARLAVGAGSKLEVTIGPRDYTCGFFIYLKCSAARDGRSHSCQTTDGTLEAWMLRHDPGVWPAPSLFYDDGIPSPGPIEHEPTMNILSLSPEQRSRLPSLIPLVGQVDLTVNSDLDEYRIEMSLESSRQVEPDVLWLANREEICRAELMRRGKLSDGTERQRLEALRKQSKEQEPGPVKIDIQMGSRLGPRVIWE